MTMQNLYLRSDAAHPKLRIGLLLDTLALPRWLAQELRWIQASNFAEISFIVFNGAARTESPSPAAPKSLVQRASALLGDSSRRRQLGYSLYKKLDSRFYSIPGDSSPWDLADLTEEFSDVEKRRVEPIAKGFTHRLKKADTEAIQAQNLDVVLRLGFNIVRGKALDVARYGVWSYHHGDNDFYRGGPPGFWELYEASETAGVLLQKLTSDLDAGVVLSKTICATNSGLSLNHSLVGQYYAGEGMVIQKLWELHQRGWDHVEKRIVPNDFRGRKKIYRRPSNLAVANFVVREGARKVASRLRSNRICPHWRMAVRQLTEPLYDAPSQVRGFHWIEAPQGHFYADPFVYKAADAHYTFFEDYSYEKGKATIACGRLTPDGLSDVRVVLDLDVHASFPFVLKTEKDLFLVPETADANAVDLYRAVDFPYRWEKAGRLCQLARAVDTVIWQESGLYWMFVTCPSLMARTHKEFSPRGVRASNELHLFYAETLDGPWQLHPQSPVSQDTRIARSGGAIRMAAGRRIRVSQDCSVRYGRALGFQEIVELTPDTFRMTPLAAVDAHDILDAPGKLQGVHTYNADGDLEMIDGVWDESLDRHLPR